MSFVGKVLSAVGRVASTAIFGRPLTETEEDPDAQKRAAFIAALNQGELKTIIQGGSNRSFTRSFDDRTLDGSVFTSEADGSIEVTITPYNTRARFLFFDSGPLVGLPVFVINTRTGQKHAANMNYWLVDYMNKVGAKFKGLTPGVEYEIVFGEVKEQPTLAIA